MFWSKSLCLLSLKEPFRTPSEVLATPLSDTLLPLRSILSPVKRKQPIKQINEYLGPKFLSVTLEHAEKHKSFRTSDVISTVTILPVIKE